MIELKHPQDYVHPRRIREIECPCGYPRIPCQMGKKNVLPGTREIDPDAYKGNYCFQYDG